VSEAVRKWAENERGTGRRKDRREQKRRRIVK
jgi:hypothetical protein